MRDTYFCSTPVVYRPFISRKAHNHCAPLKPKSLSKNEIK